MSNFANAQVTLKGNNLLARALKGETLTFTRIVMGEGEYSGAIMEAQALVSQKEELNITKLTRKENIVTIGGLLELGHLTDEFYWRELGVYAKGADNVEILYLYGSAGDKASYITNTGLDEKLIDINIVVGNARNVSAVIDSSLVFLTKESLEEHDNNEDAHPSLKVWVQNLFATGDWAKYTQVGESTDAETKPTVFGVLNKLKSLINGISAGITAFRGAYTDARALNLDKLDVYVSTRADKATLDYVGGQVGTSADAAAYGINGSGTLQAKLNNLLANSGNAAYFGNLPYLNDYISTRARQDQLGLATDAGALTAQAYHENLHQKAADILWYALSTKNNIDTIMQKGLPGDYNGKQLVIVPRQNIPNGGGTWSYSNALGGVAKIYFQDASTSMYAFFIVVDGVTIYTSVSTGDALKHIAEPVGTYIYLLEIPFTSSIVINCTNNSNIPIYAHVYLNKA
ncbi:MAG: hypothetical protein E7211_20610 [Clostridium lundense]|nr:hypothetical protein [Clostridium lundense]